MIFIKKIKIFLLFFFLTILLGIFLFWRNLINFYEYFFSNLSEIKINLNNLSDVIEKKISAPPPLIKENQEKEVFLTKEGIIEWTNKEREKYGLTPLKENPKLNESAQLKANDILQYQYFSHNSPLGKTLNYWIKSVSYEFIAIGENLALGNFKNDQSLVLAWMESPGHKANILNKDFQEIGVAVLKGFFEEKETWVAVQHFSLPLTICPSPDGELKTAIEKNESKISDLKTKIELLEKEIKLIKPKRFFFSFKEKFDQYNKLVDQYNLLIKQTQEMIDEYNKQVNLFNQCLTKYKQ